MPSGKRIYYIADPTRPLTSEVMPEFPQFNNIEGQLHGPVSESVQLAQSFSELSSIDIFSSLPPIEPLPWYPCLPVMTTLRSRFDREAFTNPLHYHCGKAQSVQNYTQKIPPQGKIGFHQINKESATRRTSIPVIVAQKRMGQQDIIPNPPTMHKSSLLLANKAQQRLTPESTNHPLNSVLPAPNHPW